MNLMIWAWLGAVVVFGVAELLTEGMVCIWFVAGALAALAAAVWEWPVAVQVVAFALVSVAAVFLGRPLVQRLAKQPAIPTNADRVIGGVAEVTEDVNNERSSGAVYVDGKTWTARSTDGRVIPAGERVRVRGIEGVKLMVDLMERTEAVK